MTQLNTSRIMDAFGLQGGDQLDFLPTVTLADFSDTLIGEMIEARGCAGFDLNTQSNGEVVQASLVSLARGGLVVTQADLEVTVGGGTPVRDSNFSRDVLMVAIGAPTSEPSLNLLEVGSGACSSEIRGATGTLTLPSATPRIPLPRSFSLQPGVRWFVPRGSALHLIPNAEQAGGNPIRLDGVLTWRELAPAAR